MLALAVTTKLLTEIALLSLMGQNVAGFLSGQARVRSPVYRLFQVISRPWAHAVRWVYPRIALDCHIPLIAMFLMLMLWVVAIVAKVNICMPVNQPWLRAVFGLISPIQPWWGIEPVSASVFGVPVKFTVIILVSLVTPKTDQKFQELAEYIRYPDLKSLWPGLFLIQTGSVESALPGHKRSDPFGTRVPHAVSNRGNAIIIGFALLHPSRRWGSFNQPKGVLCVTMRSSC